MENSNPQNQDQSSSTSHRRPLSPANTLSDRMDPPPADETEHRSRHSLAKTTLPPTENLEAKKMDETFDEKESEPMDYTMGMSGEDIAAILNSDGPTVQAVILKSDGSIEEVSYDTTPRAQMAKEFLGDYPTIIGQWDELDVILVRGRFDENSGEVPVNQHKLRWPFGDAQIPGDILCYRVNQEAVPEHFTVKEYEAFASRASEDEGKEMPEPVEVDPQTLFNWADMEEDDEDENDDDYEPDEGEGIDYAQMLFGIVHRQFVERNGREPTEEELNALSMQVMEKFGAMGGMGLNDIAEDDEDDEDFEPGDDDGDDDEDEDEVDEDGDVVVRDSPKR